MTSEYVIEMLHIRKEFPGIVANDDITLQLKKGEMVRVSEIENGWGRIEYAGGAAYISMDYADFVTPSTHTVAYTSEGKTLHSRDFFSTDKAVVASFTPEREGYEFLGWRDSAGEAYEAAQVLPTRDLVLVATWREIPPPPPAEEPEDTPENGGEMLPTAGENGPEDELEVLPPSVLVPNERDFTLASRIAGALTALVATSWIGVWIWLRKKRA